MHQHQFEQTGRRTCGGTTHRLRRVDASDQHVVAGHLSNPGVRRNDAERGGTAAASRIGGSAVEQAFVPTALPASAVVERAQHVEFTRG